MLIKTLLNQLEHFKSFVFGTVTLQTINGSDALVVEIKSRANSKPVCPVCARRGKKYDMRDTRMFGGVAVGSGLDSLKTFEIGRISRLTDGSLGYDQTNML